jgi:hypothetical protein
MSPAAAAAPALSPVVVVEAFCSSASVSGPSAPGV